MLLPAKSLFCLSFLHTIYIISFYHDYIFFAKCQQLFEVYYDGNNLVFRRYF